MLTRLASRSAHPTYWACGVRMRAATSTLRWTHRGEEARPPEGRKSHSHW